MPQRLNIVAAFATAGRAGLLGETLGELARQTRPPDAVILCPATPDDAPPDADLKALPFPVRTVLGPRGLCAQRNTILQALEPAADLVVFFDDDFFPRTDYLARLEDLALRRPDAVVITGKVLADGAPGPGIQPDEARAILAASADADPNQPERPVHNGYGCNMALSASPIRNLALRFDEALPLYGWLEDVDFCRRLALQTKGAVLSAPACQGVHLGVKAARMPGVRFGYSQVANPIHIWKKGAVSTQWAAIQMARNLAANLAKLPNPEPWVDRKGRLKGNLIAAKHILARKLNPQNINSL